MKTGVGPTVPRGIDETNPKPGVAQVEPSARGRNRYQQNSVHCRFFRCGAPEGVMYIDEGVPCMLFEPEPVTS
jgi:hypothetical protein